MTAKKKQSPMDKLTGGYERFIRSKEIKENGKEQFEKAVKKATKSKQRGSK